MYRWDFKKSDCETEGYPTSPPLTWPVTSPSHHDAMVRCARTDALAGSGRGNRRQLYRGARARRDISPALIAVAYNRGILALWRNRESDDVIPGGVAITAPRLRRTYEATGSRERIALVAEETVWPRHVFVARALLRQTRRFLIEFYRDRKLGPVIGLRGDISPTQLRVYDE